MFLGAGSRKRRQLDLDPHLLAQVFAALAARLHERRDIRSLLPVEQAFYCGAVYNRVAHAPEASRHELVYKEVDHLLTIIRGVPGDPIDVQREMLGGENVINLLGALQSNSVPGKPSAPGKRARKKTKSAD